MPSAPQRRRWLHRVVWLMAGLMLLGLLLLLALRWPTRLDALEQRHRAPSAGQALPHLRGCSLLQRERAGGCEDVSLGASFKREEVKIRSRHPAHGIAELRGTLLRPQALPGRHPAALILTGTGPTARTSTSRGGLVVRHPPWPLYQALAQELAQLGFVTLLYDRRTCGRCYPGLDRAAFRFAHLVDDAEDALAYLRSHPEVDPHGLVVVGHSHGGKDAIRLGRQDGLAATVLLAAGTAPLVEAVPAQHRRLAEARLRQLDLIGAAQLRSTAAAWDRCFEHAAAEADVPRPCLFGLTARALAEERSDSQRLTADLAASSSPLLLLQGGLDLNTHPAALQHWQALLQTSGRRHTYERVAGIGHSLVAGSEAHTPALAASVRRSLAAFLSAVGRRGNGVR